MPVWPYAPMRGAARTIRPTCLRPLAVAAMLCVPAAGCAPGTVVPVVGAAGLDVAVFHRTIPDMIYSGITGRDCSAVRLDRGESYCKPHDPPLPPQPYCTRSLAGIDCWAHPEADPNQVPQVAQGPVMLTPEQERLRNARWPASLSD